ARPRPSVRREAGCAGNDARSAEQTCYGSFHVLRFSAAWPHRLFERADPWPATPQLVSHWQPPFWLSSDRLKVGDPTNQRLTAGFPSDSDAREVCRRGWGFVPPGLVTRLNGSATSWPGRYADRSAPRSRARRFLGVAAPYEVLLPVRRTGLE